MANIGASVGKGATNNKADVLVVQHLLNAQVGAMGLPALDENGRIGDDDIRAIVRYQHMVLNVANPDGRIDVGGNTWKALVAGRTVTVTPPPAPAPAAGAQLSGGAWWRANQAKFPNSAKPADLNPPFRDRATRFINALTAAGARVGLTSTLRHPIRAYLMHYCWTVANGIDAPGAVPPKPGCAIGWDHGNLSQSKSAAREMVDLFGMAHVAALQGRHIDGHAVDMNVDWSGTLSIADASGHVHALGAPRSGETNSGLHAVGATYGVHKLVRDKPHWSIDGH
jgi:hypothetical protein